MSELMKGFDAGQFKEIQDEATEIQTEYAQRDEMFKELQNYWLMLWDKELPESEKEETKLTFAPDATNKLMGAHRLITATEPQFSMPFDENDAQAKQASSDMEPAARLMWKASGRLSGRPIEKEAALSALLFSSVHIGLIDLRDQLEMLGDGASVAERRRLEAAVQRTPLLFEVWHPLQGYPVRDRLGLVSYLRRYRTTERKLEAEWPGVEFGDYSKNNEIIVCDWYDLKYRVVYIEGASEPFLMREHGLPFIPVAEQITEGSNLFQKPEEQIRPFLYTLWKSGLDKRQNLALTALFTNIFAISSNAKFVHKKPSGSPEKTLQVNLGPVGGVIELEGDEEFKPFLAQGAIDPALLEAYNIAKQGLEESTIYSQTLGEPLGSNAPFSMVALLHQAGRLPLVSTQELTGWVIADAMEMAFKWIKEVGEKPEPLEINYLGQRAEINPQSIPDQFSFEAKLEVDLPMDQLQQANAAKIFMGGGDPAQALASKRWIRENLMNIGESDEMDEEIWGEHMSTLMAMQLFARMQQEEQQAQAEEQARAQAEAQGQEQTGTGEAPGTGEGGLTSEQRAQGLPLQRPVNPRQQGG